MTLRRLLQRKNTVYLPHRCHGYEDIHAGVEKIGIGLFQNMIS